MLTPGNRKSHPATARNYIFATLALSVLLYLLGALGLMLLYGNNAISFAKEQIPFYIELSDSASEAEIFKLEQQLSKSSYVKPASLRFISKEEALKTLAEDEISKEELLIFGENLLPNSLEFHLNSSHLGQHKKIIAELKAHPIVVNVYHTEEIVGTFNSNLQRIALVTLILVLFFIFVAVTLIKNTLKLSILSNRETIRILMISGADKKFLSAPYTAKSIRSGLISSMIAITALLLSVVIIQTQVSELSYFGSQIGFVMIFLGILVIGMLTFWATAALSVKKYLKITGEH